MAFIHVPHGFYFFDNRLDVVYVIRIYCRKGYSIWIITEIWSYLGQIFIRCSSSSEQQRGGVSLEGEVE